MQNRRRNADYSLVAQIDWARLAAFIDGEGSILINQNRQANGRVCPYLRVVITNTDPRLIRWLSVRFGGAIVRSIPAKAQHRRVFKWHVSTRQAEEVLLRCRPYFIVKGEQADIALAFQETLQGFRRGNPLPAAVEQLREQYRAQMTAERWKAHPADDLITPPHRSTAH